MTQDEAKQAHTIISYYQTKYKAKFGERPVVNRNKLQWQVSNMLKDLNVTMIKRLIDFYIKTEKQPSLQRFTYEYDEIYETMNKEAQDLETRKAIMRETQKSVEEYRRQFGDNAGN
jgi:hypothetical protein